MLRTVTLRIEDRRHRAFKSLCAAQGVTMMDAIAAYIDRYIQANGGAAVPANSAPAGNDKR